MNKKILALVGVAVVLLFAALTMVGAATLFSDDFQDGNATGWSTSSGTWSVVTDGSYVYKQASTSANCFSYTGSAWTNYTVQARVKILAFNGSNRPVGILARYSSTSNYYAAALTNANTAVIQKKVSGSLSTLASKAYTVTTGTWYTLKLVLTGTKLDFYVNDVLQASVTDSSLSSGKVGFTMTNASAEFDDIIVSDNGSTPTPTVTATATATTAATSTVRPTSTPTPTSTSSNPPTATPIPTPTGPIPDIPVIGSPVGWAALNALGQNGTTGGAGGQVIHIYDKATLESVLYKDDNPAIIVIHGTLTGGPGMINVKSNKTIVGAGSGAYLNFGLYLRGSNIIIKNLDIMNGGFEAGDSEGLDAVTFAQDVHHVWVDHCTMHETRDGLVDPTRNARFVTISYNYFHYQKTAVLIGSSDSDSAAKSAQSNTDKSLWHYTVTVHHNYWQNVYERAPRVRFGAVHVYNNYYDNNPNYAIGRGDRANIYSEANYFLNTHDAFAAYDDSSNPGYVTDVNSLFEGDNGTSTPNPPTGTWVWTPGQYYSYTPHTAVWIKQNLKNYVGIGKGNP